MGKERDEAVRTCDQANQERDAAVRARDQTIKERDAAVRARDQAIKERDDAVRECDQAKKERDKAVRERDEAIVCRDNAAEQRLKATQDRSRQKTKMETAKENLRNKEQVTQHSLYLLLTHSITHSPIHQVLADIVRENMYLHAKVRHQAKDVKKYMAKSKELDLLVQVHDEVVQQLDSKASCCVCSGVSLRVCLYVSS